MKFAILGAGATGGYLGARLIKAGESVTLIARGPHLAAMREHGLRVVDIEGEFAVQPACTDDLDAMRDADVIFLTLKAHALPPLAARLGDVASGDRVLVSAQNGIPWWYFQRHGGEFEGTHLETVDPGGALASSIDPHRVIACVVYPATSLVSPGVVRHVEGDRFSLGELDGETTERCSEIAAALVHAGLKAPVNPQIREEIWLKLLGNAVFNPISALTRAMLGDIASSPITAGVVKAAMEEVDAVARRLGITIRVPIERRIKGAARVGAHKTSMLQDLEAGRPMEIEALIGAVVELADKLTIPVPHLRTLYDCTKLLDETVRRRAAARTT